MFMRRYSVMKRTRVSLGIAFCGWIAACAAVGGCSSDNSSGSPTGTGATGGAGGTGGTGGAGGAGGGNSCTTGLAVIFNPVYSAYDGVNTYKVPLIAYG